MKIIKFLRYLIEYLIIHFLFLIFRIIGLKNSILLSSILFKFIGPIFRSKKTIKKNLNLSFSNLSDKEIEDISNDMWKYYGKIFAEYSFIKNFRNDHENKKFEIEGEEIINEIIKKKRSSNIYFRSF